MSAFLSRVVSSSTKASHLAQAHCGLLGSGGRRYFSSKENQAAKRALLVSFKESKFTKTVQKNYLSDPRFQTLIRQCLKR